MEAKTNRSGRKRKWLVGNDSTYYIDPATYRNMLKIVKWLSEHWDSSRKPWRNIHPNFKDISKGTGVSPKQVTLACWILAMKKEDPYLRLIASSMGTKNGGRTSQKVELIRHLRKA